VQVTDARGVPLRDAVVEVAPPAGNARAVQFSWRNAMAQRDQTFVPGTLIVPAGSNVAFPNLDTVRHSIYSFSRPARFKIDLYGRDQTATQRFAITGSVVLGCNIHDQMRGYIRVVATPYAAKTDTNGYARIPGLGAGRYAVTVWHPRIRGNEGEARQTLTLGTAPVPLRVTTI
jgi:plastocyanin